MTDYITVKKYRKFGVGLADYIYNSKKIQVEMRVGECLDENSNIYIYIYIYIYT